MGVRVQGRKGARRLLAAGLLTLLFCTAAVPACSNRYEDASAAYERGDYATAFRLMKPLAEQGYAKAQYNLGVMYHKGEGVPADHAEAVKWFRKAAEQGYAKAQYNLGVMYRIGDGVPQDNTETMKWYRKAAEQGIADAQYFLGVAFDSGQGVPQDSVQAYMWYSLAASRLSEAEAEKREMVLMSRGVIASRMTPEQLEEAQRLAREWKPTKEGNR